MIYSLIMRALLALAAFGMVASPVAAQIDPAARGLAVQAKQQSQRALEIATPLARPSVASLAQLRKIIARARSRSGDVRIGWVGDSKDVGTGSGTSGASNLFGALASSPTAFAAAEFARQGFSTSLGSTYSDGNVTSVGVTRAQLDPRWSVLPTDWSVRSDTTAAGRVYQMLSTGARGTFSPTETFDTITITFNRTSLSANLLVDVDGGTAQQLVPNGSTASGLIRFSLTVARGTHVIGVQPTGNASFWGGLEVSDSTTPTVRFINLGASGWRATSTLASASWSETTNTYSPLNALAVIAPDIAVVNLGTNDVLNNVSVAEFTTSLTAIVDRLRASGSFVILCTPDSFDPARGSLANQEAYRQAVIAVGAAYATPVPVIDLNTSLGAFAVRNAAPTEFFDGLHLIRNGSASRGSVIARKILEWAS